MASNSALASAGCVVIMLHSCVCFVNMFVLIYSVRVLMLFSVVGVFAYSCVFIVTLLFCVCVLM